MGNNLLKNTMKQFTFILTLFLLNISQAISNEYINKQFEDFFNIPYFNVEKTNKIKLSFPYLLKEKKSQNIFFNMEINIKSVEKILFLNNDKGEIRVVGKYIFDPILNTSLLAAIIVSSSKKPKILNPLVWVKTSENKYYFIGK